MTPIMNSFLKYMNESNVDVYKMKMLNHFVKQLEPYITETIKYIYNGSDKAKYIYDGNELESSVSYNICNIGLSEAYGTTRSGKYVKLAFNKEDVQRLALKNINIVYGDSNNNQNYASYNSKTLDININILTYKPEARITTEGLFDKKHNNKLKDDSIFNKELPRMLADISSSLIHELVHSFDFKSKKLSDVHSKEHKNSVLARLFSNDQNEKNKIYINYSTEKNAWIFNIIYPHLNSKNMLADIAASDEYKGWISYFSDKVKKRMMKRIAVLVHEYQGKPEALKYDLKNNKVEELNNDNLLVNDLNSIKI